MEFKLNTGIALLLVGLLLISDAVDAGNVAVGRSGSMRPGKRTLALGRFNFRPGKRSSLALGRFNFRPGKRAFNPGTTCDPEEIFLVAEKVESLLVDLQTYSSYLKQCGPPGLFDDDKE